MLSSLARELILATRGLLRRPVVPALLVVVVAVGVSFLTTAYSVFDALLWRPLPFGAVSRYVMLGEMAEGAQPPMPRAGVDLYAAYAEAHARGGLPALEALIPLEERRSNLAVDGVASMEMATWLLPGAMRHLQVAPLLGRHPADPDGSARAAREIAIGEQVWARRFGRRADVLGQRVTLDGEPAVVVGVMPAAFQFHRLSQVWAAWSRAELLADPTRTIPLVGRLAAGATPKHVARQVGPIWQAAFAARTPPDTARSGHLEPGPFGQDIVPAPLARLVLGTMALVLVAACLNVATLFLARLRARTADHATRAALGAGRAGVLRLVLAEVALIVAAGGALAVLLAAWLATWIRDAMAGVLPLWVDLRVDGRGLGVAVAALALALVIVALPAFRLTRRLDLAGLLVHRGVLGGAPAHGRGASALIATQVALVVVLATATLPIAISARNLADVRSGLDDDRLAQVEVNLVGRQYTDDSARTRYAAAVRARLAADPRVAGVARIGGRAWTDPAVPWSDSLFTDASAAPAPWAATRQFWESVVSERYFDVVGLAVLAGTGFPAGLRAGDEPVAVVSAEVARRLWPGTSPVGRRFRYGAVGPWTRVVGVVEDEIGIDQDWGGTTAQRLQRIYLSDQQVPAQLMTFYVRLRQVTPDALRDVRRTVEQVDPTQPVTRVRLRADVFARPRVERQWLALVLGSGAVLTVLLAMTGAFGLVSYYTNARLPELALRVALGAPVRAVVWLVARATLRSVAIGVGAGALLLTLVQRFVVRFAYATSAFDPAVLAGVLLLVLGVAATALAVPLRRVQRLAPQELLRPD